MTVTTAPDHPARTDRPGAARPAPQRGAARNARARALSDAMVAAGAAGAAAAAAARA